MKAYASKSGPSRTFQELADLQLLLGLPGVDEAGIRGYFDRRGLPGRCNELKQTLNQELEQTPPAARAADEPA